jgi:hypothetical protein
MSHDDFKPPVYVYPMIFTTIVEIVGAIGCLFSAFGMASSGFSDKLSFAGYFSYFCWSLLFLGVGLVVHLLMEGVSQLHRIRHNLELRKKGGA